MIQFEKLRIDTQAIYQPFYDTFDNEVSELTFTNLFMWRNKYHFKYAVIGDFFWVLNESESGNWYFSPPVGDYSKDVEASILQLKAFLAKEHRPFVIKKAGSKVVSHFEGFKEITFQAEADRNAFDYVYDFEGLRDLTGKTYHKKKNHVNKFLKTYDNWEYEPLSIDAIASCRECISHWCEINGCSGDLELNQEHQAILSALDHYESLPYEGGLIKIDGITQAFTMAEMLNPDTIVIHIEKANTRFQGLYTAINQMYLSNTTLAPSRVNREQDMGIPGLRKAKLSYHPVKMIEKFNITLL